MNKFEFFLEKDKLVKMSLNIIEEFNNKKSHNYIKNKYNIENIAVFSSQSNKIIVGTFTIGKFYDYEIEVEFSNEKTLELIFNLYSNTNLIEEVILYENNRLIEGKNYNFGSSTKLLTS